jgi:hypothetical protein
LHNVKTLNAIGLVVEIFVIMTPQRFEIARHFHCTVVARDTNASVFAQAPLEARACCKNWRKASIVSLVKEIVVVFAIAGSLAMVGCSLLGSGEEVRDEPRRSIYRAANENPVDNPDVTPVQEKVPGESR